MPMSMADSKQAPIWEVNRDQLVLITDRAVEHLSADQIYSIVFEGAPEFRGLEVEPVLPDGLEFNRCPAQLIAEIRYAESTNDSGLSLSFIATAESGSQLVQDLPGRWSDHIVIGGCWFPFAPGAKEEILSSLDKIGIHRDGPLTLRQYLALRQIAGTVDWLNDTTAGQKIHPGINAEQPKDSLGLFKGSLYLHIFDSPTVCACIFDNGLGMSREDFTDRWLVLGTSSKVDRSQAELRDTKGLPTKYARHSLTRFVPPCSSMTDFLFIRNCCRRLFSSLLRGRRRIGARFRSS